MSIKAVSGHVISNSISHDHFTKNSDWYFVTVKLHDIWQVCFYLCRNHWFVIVHSSYHPFLTWISKFEQKILSRSLDTSNILSVWSTFLKRTGSYPMYTSVFYYCYKQWNLLVTITSSFSQDWLNHWSRLTQSAFKSMYCIFFCNFLRYCLTTLNRSKVENRSSITFL